MYSDSGSGLDLLPTTAAGFEFGGGTSPGDSNANFFANEEDLIQR